MRAAGLEGRVGQVADPEWCARTAVAAEPMAELEAEEAWNRAAASVGVKRREVQRPAEARDVAGP